MARHGSKLAASLIGAACVMQPIGAEPTGTRPQGAGTTASRLTAEECATRTSDNAAACDGLFPAIMEYQKRVNREAREDRRLQRDGREIELNAKPGKIKTDNQAIEQGMQEAREKADAAQQSAATDSAIGVIGGTLQAAGGGQRADATATLCRDPKTECQEPCKLPPCE